MDAAEEIIPLTDRMAPDGHNTSLDPESVPLWQARGPPLTVITNSSSSFPTSLRGGQRRAKPPGEETLHVFRSYSQT